MSIPKLRLIVGLIISSVLLSSGCAHKYAVLVSTGETTADDVMIHSEYWYDLFLQYKMLRQNGFKDEKIYVLYGSGNDFATMYNYYDATTQFGHSITDMAVNKTNIQNVFSDLKNKVKKRDYLYVWWMGHGGGSGAGMCDLSMSIATTGEHVTDAELANYLNSITKYRKREVAVMTCHSGGMVDNFNTAGNNTVTHTSSSCTQSSFSITTTCNNRVHAEFNYTFPNALSEHNPCGSFIASDDNGDGYVSMSEAHLYNQTNMTTSTPQLGDPDTIANTTEIKKRRP
ncbi:MAG: hypothetical protein AMJ53_18695 [Gammaproteobacteria bacterium SG8_11]|nr:MAG: hypothetical protein AMJ53_18695 [Gammaproteobacteria bacterium SG8_11]